MLLALILSTLAHADLNDWSKQHTRQFEAKWRNNPKEIREFCKERQIHQYEFGVLPADGLVWRWIAVTNGRLRTALAGDALGFRRRLEFGSGFNKRGDARLNIGAI